MGAASSRVTAADETMIDLTESPLPAPRRRRHIPASSLPSRSRRARHSTTPPRGANGKNREDLDDDLGDDGARVKRRRVDPSPASTAGPSSTEIAMSDPTPPVESLPTMFETLPTPITNTSEQDQSAAPLASPPVVPLSVTDPLLPERLSTLETLASVYGPQTVAHLPDVAPLLDPAQAQRHHVDPQLASDLARRARRPPRATFAHEPRPVGVDSAELTQRLDRVRVGQGRLSTVGNRLLAHLEGRQHFHAASGETQQGPRVMPAPSIPPAQERAPLVLHSLITVPGTSRPSSVASEPEAPPRPSTSMSSLRALKETLFPSTQRSECVEATPSSPAASEPEEPISAALEQASVIADMTSFGALATTAAFIGTQLLASNAISDLPSSTTRLPVATRDIVRRLVDELSTRLRAGTAVPPNIFEEALSQAMADAGGSYVSAAASHRRRMAARAAARELSRTREPSTASARSPSPVLPPIGTSASTPPPSQPDTFDEFLNAFHTEIINGVTSFEARASGSRSGSPEPSPAAPGSLELARAYVFPQRAPDALTREGADPSVDEAANVLVTVVGLRSITPAQSDAVMEQWRAGTAGAAAGSEPQAVPAAVPEETPAEREARPSFLRSLSRGWSRSRHVQPEALQTQVVSHRTMAEAEAATASTTNSRTYVFWSFSGNFARNHPYLTNLDLLYTQLQRHTVSDIVPILGQPKPKVATELDILTSGLEIVPGEEVEKRVERGEIVANCAEQCLICYAGFEPDDQCRIMRCRHMYHQGCVDKWMRDHHNTCPVCRADGVVASFPGVREAQVRGSQSI